MFKWSIAVAFGIGLGFVAALSPGILEEARTGMRPPVGTSTADFLTTLVGWLAAGAILGAAQSVVLRSASIPVKKWVFASIAGFGIGAVILDWPLQALGLLGNIPGPVEPIILTHGGGILASILQYFLLRREGISGERWLLFWIIGLVISLIPAALFFIAVLDLLGAQLNWATEVFLHGFIVAGVAALFSARHLFSAIDARA